MKRKLQVKEMVLIAILAALSTILMLLKFPLPFMPPFMSFDFAAIPELIGGFILGPVGAFFIILIKILLKIVMQGSNSMFTGEIQNLILSCAFVIPASIIYRKNKTRKNAIIGLSVGTIIMSIVAVLSNYFFIIPFYAVLFNYSMSDIIAMSQAVNPLITSPMMLIAFGIVPFNIIKGLIISTITILIYKKISVLLKKEYTKKDKRSINNEL